MAKANYKVTIINSSKELTAKERVAIKDTTECVKLDDATNVESVIIDLDYYVALHIENENSDDKEYDTYILVDKNGTRYSTGSSGFYDSFIEIYEEMHNEDEEWKLKCYKMPSKKREGKSYLTCSII